MPRWQPDAKDADRMDDRMATMEHLTGLDAEVPCEVCHGTKQPGEICCGQCRKHHRVGDDAACAVNLKLAETDREWERHKRKYYPQRERYSRRRRA